AEHSRSGRHNAQVVHPVHDIPPHAVSILKTNTPIVLRRVLLSPVTGNFTSTHARHDPYK
ncbi:TPA: hypothetical protein ACUNBZ_004737, partial [Escherichia fergusonii]